MRHKRNYEILESVEHSQEKEVESIGIQKKIVNTMITIEKVTVKDIPEVKQLLSYPWKDAYGSFLEAQTIEKVTTVWHHPEALKSQAENPDIYFAVAKDENSKIVGLITLGRVDKKRVHLGRLYVHPEVQRQGIGHQLLIAALKAFPNMEVIRLEVEEENKKGVSFYYKQGFREVERKIDDVEGEKMKSIIMEKTLC